LFHCNNLLSLKLSEGDYLEKYNADKYIIFPNDIDEISEKEYVFRV